MDRIERGIARKQGAARLQNHAAVIESGTIGSKRVLDETPLSEPERRLIRRAEDLALKAANVLRRVGNHMEQAQ